MTGVVQLIGFLLLVAAAVVLWSPWALLIGGVLALLGPELVLLRARSRD